MCQEFCTKLSGTCDLTKVDDKCHLVHLHNALCICPMLDLESCEMIVSTAGWMEPM
jgi:hypothetical protein